MEAPHNFLVIQRRSVAPPPPPLRSTRQQFRSAPLLESSSYFAGYNGPLVWPLLPFSSPFFPPFFLSDEAGLPRHFLLFCDLPIAPVVSPSSILYVHVCSFFPFYRNVRTGVVSLDLFLSIDLFFFNPSSWYPNVLLELVFFTLSFFPPLSILHPLLCWFEEMYTFCPLYVLLFWIN